MNNTKSCRTRRFFSVAYRCLLSALLLSVLVLADCSFAVAEEGYLEIGRTDDSIYSLLITSVEKREQYGNEYIVGWIKTIIRKPEPSPSGEIASYLMELCAVNTEIKQIQSLSLTVYDKDGQVLFSESNPFATYRWEDCVPDTVGEAFWYVIMSTYHKQRK